MPLLLDPGRSGALHAGAADGVRRVSAGGLAGGAKAVHMRYGLFLKTPDDSHGIYGSMVMAAKVMKLETNANR